MLSTDVKKAGQEYVSGAPKYSTGILHFKTRTLKT